MAPTLETTRSLVADNNNPSPMFKAWKDDRLAIHTSLHGRRQENASTTRHNIEKRIDSFQKSPEQTRSRNRQNSLKRVKNSNEVLRQRTTKKGTKEVTDVNSSTREPRHFTVANVGGNGKIYLRYAGNRSIPKNSAIADYDRSGRPLNPQSPIKHLLLHVHGIVRTRKHKIRTRRPKIRNIGRIHRYLRHPHAVRQSGQSIRELDVRIRYQGSRPCFPAILFLPLALRMA